ncbi:MAG: iron-containing alcohol dehydrogenase, partial [Lachnospiraceae bacterium]
YALLLSGLAMQMIGNSRPASGAEHHISHLWEMEVINKHVEALHGEKVSVGLIHVLDKYDQIKRAIQLNRCEVVKNEGIEAILLKNTFGKKGLLEGIMEENTPDPLAKVDENHLRKVLPEIAHVLESMPDKQVVLEWLKRAGSVTEMKQVGLEEDILPLTLKLSPYVRNRLTLMRLSKMLVLH